MHKPSGSEIPDTAPDVEWLAIVGSIVVAFCFAQSYSQMAS
jgi:hypothetical protein